MLVEFLEHNGVGYSQMTIAQLKEAGIPQSAIDKATSSTRVHAIKAECRRRIYAVASAEKQMNMATLTGVISSKSVSARSDKEKAVLVGAEKAIGWVNAMKQEVAVLVANSEANITADELWPPCPPEVTALVGSL